jgi:hypothetical protein
MPIVNLAKTLTLEIYNEKVKQRSLEITTLENELQELEKHIKAATNKFIATTSSTIQTALERQIEELENQRQMLDKSIGMKNTKIEFGTALKAVMKFIGNPHDVWVSGDLSQKRLVQKLVFRRPIVIDPSQAIGTAELSLPFKMLKDISSGKKQFVEAAGIEPASANPLLLGLHV